MGCSTVTPTLSTIQSYHKIEKKSRGHRDTVSQSLKSNNNEDSGRHAGAAPLSEGRACESEA